MSWVACPFSHQSPDGDRRTGCAAWRVRPGRCEGIRAGWCGFVASHGATQRAPGWYIPTGGNLLAGVQTGVTLGRTDFTLRVGQVVGVDSRTKPLIPFYTQLS